MARFHKFPFILAFPKTNTLSMTEANPLKNTLFSRQINHYERKGPLPQEKYVLYNDPYIPKLRNVKVYERLYRKMI
tara:strand:- start:92 stop:319 length:228 start_codon:yes stop_codon:yes gene_type:complete